jgi:hypothetical protein
MLPDLAVQMSTNPPIVAVDGVSTMKITVTNTGTATALVGQLRFSSRAGA